jgi:hypothetical protein
MSYVSDDYLVLESEPKARAHAVYGTAKLDERSLQAFADLARAVTMPSDGYDKAVVDLARLRPDRLASQLPVTAVVLPRIGAGGETQMRLASAALATRALAASTIFQAPDGGAAALSLIADVVRSVPTYELVIGDDLSAAPVQLAALAASGG